jgi:hypothetical protein
MPTNAFVSKERINKNCDDIGTRQRNSNEVCISVAWDWIFQGHTARGIMEEAGVALESAVANHRGAVKRPVYSLGKTETCVIGALRAALAVEENKEEKRQEDEVSWNKSWILSEYNKENDTKCVDSKEAKQIIQGLGTVILDHIARPYDEYEIVQKEEEKQEEEEETLRQCGSLKLSMDIFEASHKAMERIVFQSESSDEIKSHISSLALKNAIKLARQARQDLKHVCEAQLNVLRAKARDQLVHPIIDIDDTVVDVAVRHCCLRETCFSTHTHTQKYNSLNKSTLSFSHIHRNTTHSTNQLSLSHTHTGTASETNNRSVRNGWIHV